MRKTAAHHDLLFLRQERDLDAVHLGNVIADDVERRRHGEVVIAGAPIAGERGVEHLAQPVDDHRLLHLGEDARIDLGVVVRALRRPDERAARHQDDAPAHRFDRLDLRLVGADHVVERDARGSLQLLGAGAARDQCTRA